MECVTERFVSLAEALALLEKRKKDGELGYEQQNTLAYLQEFAKLSPEESGKLAKELRELGLSEQQVFCLVNLLPRKEEEIRLILAVDKRVVSPEQVKGVLKTVKKLV